MPKVVAPRAPALARWRGKFRNKRGGSEDGSTTFIELRDRLLREGIPQGKASQAFHWLAIAHFNWAQDYFDRIAASNDLPALRVVDDAGCDKS